MDIQQPTVDRLYTRGEAAAALRVSRPTVDKLVNAGRLKRVKMGAASRITGVSLARVVRGEESEGK